MDLAIVPGPRVIRHQLLGIGRPGDRAERIVISFRPVEAERDGGLGGASGPQEDVEVLDQRIPLAIERSADLRSFGSRRRAAPATTLIVPLPRTVRLSALGCRTA